MSHIINLQAENYKRLKAVNISPDGNLVVLSGANDQGKTSILDAILAAFQGGKAAKTTSQPIRNGQDTAWVRVEIDEYIITRRWTKDDAGTLTVESHDHAKYQSPQKLLDALVGSMSFDPYAFIGMTASEQVNALVEAIGDALPFNPKELAAERKGIFDRRTEVGRDADRLAAQVQGYPDLDENLPETEVSLSELIKETELIAHHNRGIDELESGLRKAQADMQSSSDRIEQAKRALEDAENDNHFAILAATELEKKIASSQRKNLDDVNERIQLLETTNARIRQQKARQQVAEAAEKKKGEKAQLTLALKEIDKKKADGIAAANFPDPKLSFNDDGVTYNGIPFSQASTAQQLRAAVAVAIAANPRLRVIRIDKGESLDTKQLALLEELAAEHNTQVWISRVDESGAVGFVIEEGEVKK